MRFNPLKSMANPDTSRHQRRIHLVQAIFLWENQVERNAEIKRSRDDQEATLNYVWENDLEMPKPSDMADFDRERFFGVVDNLEEIRNLIKIYAPEWPIERIASHDRAILYLSIYELLHSDVPAPVVINEAVELAKDFGGNKSTQFINGVLSSINKSKQSKNALQ